MDQFLPTGTTIGIEGSTDVSYPGTDAFDEVVGSIPGSVKWLAFLFGYSGSKYRGIRLMQETITKGKLLTSWPSANFR